MNGAEKTISYPWLKQYDRGIPHTLQPYPEQTLLDVAAESAKMRPAHPAMIFKGARISYSDLEKLSDTFAAALIDLGIKKGDRVVFMLPNCPQFVICQFGAWKAGAIVVPLNPFYTPSELEHGLNEIDAKTAVVLSPFYEKLKSIQLNTSLDFLILTNIKEYLPPAKRLIFSLTQESKDGHKVNCKIGDRWLGNLMKEYAGEKPAEKLFEPRSPALLMFTGGTTGRPKAALSFHQGLLMAGTQINAWMGDIREVWSDVTLMLMPMFHSYGNIGAMSAALVGRSPMALVPNPRDLDDLITTIQQVRPAYLCGVPTLFTALLNHPEVKQGKADFSSIKLCICGAAALMEETRQRFEEMTGGRIVEGYGLTESVLAMVMTPVQGENKEGAVGLPLPDVKIRIVDDLLGSNEMPPGEIGEILIGAPQLMLRYWRRPEETAEILRDGWLYTGDLGYLDEDGYLYLIDRKKDVIKPSGFQVWPTEVEEVIAKHPSVSEVGVAGIPDPLRGEAVKAWVVLKEGHSLSASELRAFCREDLASYKVPRRVVFCDELPKSAVGKVLRRKLVDLDC